MTDFPIIPASERTTEPEMLEALIGFLEPRGYKEAKFKDVWNYLPGWIKLTEADKHLSKRGEPHWHTIVRNIHAHIYEDPNYDSRIKRVPGGFQLTSYVKKKVS
jgi:hypothetical protein